MLLLLWIAGTEAKFSNYIYGLFKLIHTLLLRLIAGADAKFP